MSNTELQTVLTKYLEENKPLMLSQIAKEHNTTELEVASALPETMISFASKDAFEEIWKQLITWEKCTFIVQHLGSTFEICGALNKGSFGHGYFNLNGKEALHGHIDVEDLASIAFLSMPFMGLESLSLQFFNEAGEVKFSIYVGRENRVLIPEAKDSFLNMKKEFTTNHTA